MPKATKKTTTKKTPASKASSGNASFLENANMVHALSYFPYFIGAVAMFFLGQSDKKTTLHHVKYSALLALGAFILFLVLNSVFANIVNLAYIALSGFFAFKAYNGEEVKVEILDTIEDKISETVKK